MCPQPDVRPSRWEGVCSGAVLPPCGCSGDHSGESAETKANRTNQSAAERCSLHNGSGCELTVFYLSAWHHRSLWATHCRRSPRRSSSVTAWPGTPCTQRCCGTESSCSRSDTETVRLYWWNTFLSKKRKKSESTQIKFQGDYKTEKQQLKLLEGDFNFSLRFVI